MSLKPQKKQLKIFSFFSGIGLLDLGFESNGAEVVFVNEINDRFLEGYKYSRQTLGYKCPKYDYWNNSIESFLNGELSHVLSSFIKKESNSKNITLFLGGPPCPDFSIGGKNKGANGEKGKLTKTYFEIINKFQPDIFLFENVKGLFRTKKHREFFDNQIESTTNNYKIHYDLLNALEFGVPQDRDRVICIGFLKKKYGHIKDNQLNFNDYKSFNKFTVTNLPWIKTNPFKENAESIAPNNILTELTVQYWFDKNKVETHPNSNNSFKPRAALSKFKIIPEGDDSKKSFKRLHRWRYSPTAAYGNNEVHLHPYKARRISAAEALAIQSAPDQFHLPLSMPLSHMFKAIGNAVPYLMAKKISKLIFENM